MTKDSIFSGGPGTLALAFLTDEAVKDPESTYARFHERIEQDAQEPAHRAAINSAAFILMGLRYDNALINRLFREVSKMRESSTYQQILREGMQEERVTGLLEGHVEGRVERRVEGVRTAIQIMGEQRFGAAMPNQQAALESIRDFDRLQLISKRVLAAANWDDLLATS